MQTLDQKVRTWIVDEWGVVYARMPHRDYILHEGYNIREAWQKYRKWSNSLITQEYQAAGK